MNGNPAVASTGRLLARLVTCCSGHGVRPAGSVAAGRGADDGGESRDEAAGVCPSAGVGDAGCVVAVGEKDERMIDAQSSRRTSRTSALISSRASRTAVVAGDSPRSTAPPRTPHPSWWPACRTSSTRPSSSTGRTDTDGSSSSSWPTAARSLAMCAAIPTCATLAARGLRAVIVTLRRSVGPPRHFRDPSAAPVATTGTFGFRFAFFMPNFGCRFVAEVPVVADRQADAARRSRHPPRPAPAGYPCFPGCRSWPRGRLPGGSPDGRARSQPHRHPRRGTRGLSSQRPASQRPATQRPERPRPSPCQAGQPGMSGRDDPPAGGRDTSLEAETAW